jgi:short-subunit dehydrogenase
MSYWQDKRAIVTGGTLGLGKQLARLLVERGARVAVVARGQEGLDNTARELSACGGQVLAIAADVTKDADMTRLAATIRDAWGGADFLCHSAGRSMRSQAISTPVEKYQELFELNFLSSVRCIQAFHEMLAASRGHYVMMGSLAGKIAPRYYGAYPASKFAVSALAQQLRLELGPQGVHVLLVCPGPILREVERRYEATDVPPEALTVAAGAKLRSIDPNQLAVQILRACERRRAELVVPGKARLLFAVSQLWPELGDWILRRRTPDPD